MKKNTPHDAMGQRISKTVTNKNTTDGTDKFVTTYYVRDPQGNVLAGYEHKRGETGDGTLTLTEQHLYGAGRLGMRKRDLALNVANASESTPPVTHYELTNHLGNVMAVITDKATADSTPMIASLSDYYPFGMTQPGRSYSHPGDDYRFGYTGHEKEKDLAKETYITEFRSLNTQTGRWLSVDPLWMKYPAVGSYVYCMNNPMSLVDIEGADIKIAGKNNSYVVFKTDLININVSAASLGIDWGGQYDLDGEDILGAALDIVGIFDPTGIADGANALLQAKKGNYFDAIISGAGLIPYVGDVAKVGKVKKDVKIIEGAIDAVNKGKKALHFGGRTFYSSQKLAKYKELANHYGGKVADALWDSGIGGANKLAKALKSVGTGKQAHHLIPRELLKDNKLVQKAVEEGFDFNGVVNGIALEVSRHSGSHPNYTKMVRGLIDKASKNDKLKTAKDKMEWVANTVKNKI